MERNRQGYLVSDTHRECTNCHNIFVKTSGMTLCARCNTSRVKSTTPEYKMWQRAKTRSRLSGREFTLTVSDINIPKTCPILGTELVVNSGKSGAYKNSPSLDRVDNSRGYTPDNVVVVSQLANAMKCHATNKELVAFAKWVLANIPAED